VKPRSIAFRLISAVLLVEAVSFVVLILLSLEYERHAHFRAFDVMLQGRADSVLGAVEDADDADDNVLLNQSDIRVPPDDIYEVFESNGRLLGRSPNWQGEAATPPRPGRNGNNLRLELNHRHYQLLRLQGSRIVDPGEPGGGKLHRLSILYGAPVEPVWHAINGAVEFYAIGGLILLLVTGPLIAWLLNRGLDPLRELASLAGRVSVESWEFSPPASARLTPELAPLTRALESALQRLESSFRKQRVFVSDAAHELKTAVAVVKSSLQLLSMKQRSVEEYSAGLDRCLADTARLEEIVGRMLMLAREESATAPTGPPPWSDLLDAVRHTAAHLETFATLRGVRVSIAASESASSTVRATAEECSVLVSNLLLNAIQHSPPGAAVEARLVARDEMLELEIEDHGDGIEADALPHVFDRFFRGDPSRTRDTGGTGLGLAICKAIAERAGGTIAIASRQGVGSTATVRLPQVQISQPVSSA
jgi:signal transduction histidine kinase